MNYRQNNRINTPKLPHPHTPTRCGVWVLTFALLLILGRGEAASLSARQILEKASKNFEVISDYTTNVNVTVDSPSVHMKDMRATVYYKSPDKLHVDSKEGFAMLPRKGLMIGNPLRALMDSSDLFLKGSERVLGNDCYVVKASMKKDGIGPEATVWIDKSVSLIRQMVVKPEVGPTVTLNLWYSRVGGKYWMPTSTTAKMLIQAPEARRFHKEKPGPGQPMVVKIKFSDYKVNTGLSDKIFQDQGGKH